MRVIDRTIVKKVYIAKDGKEFKDEFDCQYHEDELAQKEKEQILNDRIMVKTDTEFPALLNPGHDREHMLFLIQNEKDLDEFIDVYEYWFTNLERYPQVDKRTFSYPEILYILEFPTGYEERRLYRMSQLIDQLDSFKSEIMPIFSK